MTKSIVKIEVLANSMPQVVKWHPKKENLAVIGYKSGQVSFVDVQTLQTYTMTITSSE
jgi:hypothetical protein